MAPEGGAGGHGAWKATASESSGAEASWRLGNHLGGRVYRAMSGLDIFAVKSLPLAQGASDASSQEATRRELERLRRLRHPCIASVIGFDLSPAGLYIHMHYAGGGSMEGYLADFGPLGSRLLDRAVAEVLQGLAFLHACQPPVVHGNLKGSNILVTTKLGAKLSDFGCASLPVRRPSLVHARCLPWAAPEVATGDCHDGLKADMWSLSCCVLEMATAARPWGTDVSLEKLALILRGLDTHNGAATPPLPTGLQGHALLVAQRGLRRSPRARPEARDLLAAVLGSSTPAAQAPLGARPAQQMEARDDGPREGA